MAPKAEHKNLKSSRETVTDPERVWGRKKYKNTQRPLSKRYSANQRKKSITKKKNRRDQDLKFGEKSGIR